MRRCAFLSMDDLTGFVAHDHHAYAPFADRGWHVDLVPWRAEADWSTYEAVIIRTPWDYFHHADEFLSVLNTIDQSSARLLNPLDIVRWNLDKRYLRDLDERGIPIVPTLWATNPSADDIRAAFDEAGGDQIVVKPIVGGGSVDTFWLRRDDPPERIAEVARTFAGRKAMIQPFVEKVVTEGEFSVFSFAGTYSHTILKTPKTDDFRVQEEHGGILQAVEPEPALRAAADAALAWIDPPLLYARADLVRLDDGRFAIIELEFIEPSLYFPFSEGSAERFADAFVGMV